MTFTGQLSERETKALREMSQINGVYYWAHKTCEGLVAKGLAKRILDNPPGHQLTNEGSAVVAGLPDRKRR